MPLVKVVNQGKTIRVGHGANLRKALLSNGLTPYRGFANVANCKGAGTCGTCTVDILRGETNDRTIVEKFKATSQRDLSIALLVFGVLGLLAAFFAPLRGLNAWVGLAAFGAVVAGSALLGHYKRADKPLAIFGGDLWVPKRRLSCQTKVYGDIEIDTLTDPAMPEPEPAAANDDAEAKAA